MKSNGIEYKIYKNGTGKQFKVMIKGPGFMGFERWLPLYKEWCSGGLIVGPEWFTINPRKENGRVITYPYYNRVAFFDTCKEAKEAAIEYSKQHLADEWEECRC